MAPAFRRLTPQPTAMLDAVLRASRRAVLLLTLTSAVAAAQFPAAPAGASVFVIDSAEIAASNARTLSELLAARVPGLSVMRSGGSAAEGTSLRMRGVHSFLVPTTPVLVVDGVRVSSRQATSTIGSTVESSEIDELLPQDIARIEVLEGPAAAASYGPGAADGVIVITTKSGAPGPLAWEARSDAGMAMKPTKWPANYAMNGVSTSGQPTDFCPILYVLEKVCTPTTLSRFNPLNQASPFHVERTAAAHLGASGGRGRTAAYVGASAERTDGVLDGDDLRRFGARARVSQGLPFGLSVVASGGVTRDDAHVPNLAATLGAGLLGSAQNDSLHGYQPSAQPFALPPSRRFDRAMGAATLRWRPTGWLDAAFVAGADRVNGREGDVVPYLSYTGSAPDTVNGAHNGWRHDDVRTTRTIVAASYHLPADVAAHTSLSYDRYTYRSSSHDSLAFFMGYSTRTSRQGVRVSGLAVDQKLVWRDRFTVDGGLRRSGPAPFGGEGKAELYPWASAAWSAPGTGAATALRVRAAYGEAASTNPDVPVSLQFYGGPGASPVPPARAERTREAELGLDTRFGERAGASVTAFRATSSHLMVVVPTPSGTIVSPVGRMRNSGIELQLNGRLMQRAGLRWDATMMLSTLRNRVVSIGDVPPFIRTRSPLVTSAIAPGHPLGSWWARPYTWADVNGDHMIDTGEVHFAPASTYLGSALPTTEAALRSGLELAHGISADVTLDYRGGYKIRDVNEATRCSGFVFNCRGAHDPSAPLADQAAPIALLQTYQADAFIEDASFLRLRELSVGWQLPARWARVTGNATRISLVGRDLATFTRYRGVDPEITGGAPGDLPRYDFEKLPILPTVLLRVDLGGRAGH